LPPSQRLYASPRTIPSSVVPLSKGSGLLVDPPASSLPRRTDARWKSRGSQSRNHKDDSQELFRSKKSRGERGCLANFCFQLKEPSDCGGEMLASSRWLLRGALVLCLALSTSAGWRAPPLAFSHGASLRSFGGHREVRREIFALRPCMAASSSDIDVDARPKVVYDTMEKTVGRTPMVRLVRMDKEGEARGNVVLAKVRLSFRATQPVKSRTNHSHARTGPKQHVQDRVVFHASLRFLAAARSRP
jgi:hypothetical protein